MKYYDYNSGEFRTGKGGKNRFITSQIVNDERSSSIAIISLVLLLAIITCTFFACSGDFSFPTWIFWEETSEKHDINDPNNTNPYATKTDKTQFVANGNGSTISGINSQYAILVRLSDMSVVGSKNADTVIYPASMTKVMTVITALDHIENLDDEYIITRRVLNTVPSGSSTASLSIYLQNGDDTVTVRDLLYGIAYMSGSDSVLCLIDYLGLTVDQFVVLMNQKAQRIGLTSTTFGGAIGMDTEKNQTTCRDMAAIMSYAMENPVARELFSGGKHPLDIIEGYSYYHSTLDTLLGRMDTSANALLGNYTLLAAKSGYEDNAGYCLVSYIQSDETGERFVLVTAKAEKAEWPSPANPIYDMVKIFDKFEP